MIDFSQYCINIYPDCENISSQGLFVTKLFSAGGSVYFDPKNQEYQKKLFNGQRKLAQPLKDSFPVVINFEDITNFFNEYLVDSKIGHLMATFNIPVGDIDKEKLNKALARQFVLFIKSKNNNVENIVASEYQRLLADPTAPTTFVLPLYQDDDAYVRFLPERTYNKKCNEKFEHRWQILNNGQCKWQDRKLVFVNLLSEGPKVSTTSIGIPDTEPGKETTLAVQYDSGGFERRFECRWDMQDSSGNNCFPNDERKFLVTINVDLGE